MLGYIHSAERGTTNAVLTDLAARLQAEGRRVAGLVQTRAPGDDAHPCDMELTCLPDGPSFAIAQQLGRGSRGCRMDLDALETAVANVAAALEPGASGRGADVLIINKFGSQEAQGRGFCDGIGRALELGIPVVTIVNPLNITTFLDFAGDYAHALPGDAAQVYDWVSSQLA
jgi:nucleoside-triphosphatase THEP1